MWEANQEIGFPGEAAPNFGWLWNDACRPAQGAPSSRQSSPLTGSLNSVALASRNSLR